MSSNRNDAIEKNVQFHWSEGNKFALEFCKSFFLFNSALSASLLAYLANNSKTIEVESASNLKVAIFIFLIVTAFSIILFLLGYLINLRHGNSYKQDNEDDSDRIWKSANRLQLVGYFFLALVIFVFAVGFYYLFKGMTV